MREYFVIVGLFSIISVSCGEEISEQKNPSEPQFIALAQIEDKDNIKIKGLLIDRVHKEKWDIAFGVSDNADCEGTITTEHYTQIENSIALVLREWLRPLREKSDEDKKDNTVSKFSFQRVNIDGKCESSNTPQSENCSLPTDDDVDLNIILDCEEGTSFASPSKRQVHLRVDRNNEDKIFGKNNHLSDLKKRMLTTLAHEIGHTFGLADTYYDKEKYRDAYNVTDGGSKFTTGTQPVSIMSVATIVGMIDGKLKLTTDDEQGVRWLYRRAFGELKLGDCPRDYVYEENTKGCTPKYPLIFAVRQGSPTILLDYIGCNPDSNQINFKKKLEECLLEKKDEIGSNINAKDDYGNTALAYAKTQVDRHGSFMYDLLVALGADELQVELNDIPPEDPLPEPQFAADQQASGDVKKETSENRGDESKKSCGTIGSSSSLFTFFIWLLPFAIFIVSRKSLVQQTTDHRRPRCRCLY